MPAARPWRRAATGATAVLLALAAACGGAATPPAAPGSSPAAPADPARTASAGPTGGEGPAPSGAATEGLTPVPVTVPAGMGDDPFNAPRQALVPPGWSMAVWARVPGARMEAFAPDGALLVSRPGAGEVVRLVAGPNGPTSTPLVDGLTQPHGLTFVGNTLYIAESNAVRSYPYQGGSLGAPTTVVDDLPDARSPDLRGAYAHALKSVAVGPDGSVYVSVGSTANVSPQDRDSTPQRASILRIPPGGGAAEPYARGVRNGTGLAVAPDGAVWTAVNNRDNIPFPYDRPYGDDDGSARGRVIPDYVDDHPPEELARLYPGRDVGWPFCNPDPDVNPGVAGSAVDPSDVPFVADAETNPDGRALDCRSLTPIEQTMGAHSAPLGLAFGTLPAPYGQGALVGVHGSWNRQTPRAPEVSFYSWRGGALDGQRTLVGGFQGPDGSRWGRPVAAVQGPDGAVYITDDGADAVYRLAPPGR
ncbi:PQQ-dependent sugar dehydrogenase [Actinomycetospora sp. C-140]